jgi:hypothetical protein
VDRADGAIYIQSSTLAYMPFIEVSSRMVSWDRCGTAPRELIAIKCGVLIGSRPGSESKPTLASLVLDVFEIEKESSDGNWIMAFGPALFWPRWKDRRHGRLRRFKGAAIFIMVMASLLMQRNHSAMQILIVRAWNVSFHVTFT